MAPLANKRLDALTTLVGWINSTATDPLERTRLSNEVVRLTTPLDAAEQITLVTSHPGAGSPITVVLALAPLLKDGSTGTFVNAATVVIPAVGGLIETVINPANLVLAGADGANSKAPCLFFARATVSPTTPPGCHVSLTH